MARITQLILLIPVALALFCGCATSNVGTSMWGLPPGIHATFTADNEWRVGQTATLNVTWGERHAPPLYIRCFMGGGTEDDIPGAVVEETSFTHTFLLTEAGTFEYRIELGALPFNYLDEQNSTSQARGTSLSINNPAYGSYTVEPALE